MSLAAGTRLGPYQVVAPLGVGGMGEVYKATDTRLGRTVAIKVLPEHLSADSDRRHRFEREAKAISALNHPHICTLYDIGSASSPQAATGQAVFYLVMEHLEGETLAQRLSRSALPIRQVVEIGAQIADALDAAHKQGVVHRDLKPGNVMLTSGGVKLLDFGLAKLAREQAADGASVEPTRTVQGALTDHGAAVGTVAYMSPEQATGEEVDARSDLFSLGVVLYEMVTRHQPFTGATAATTFDAILHKAPTSPVRLNPEVPADLERIIDKTLEKDRDLRYQTAADLRSDFNRLNRDSDSAHGTAIAGRAPSDLHRRAVTLLRPRWARWAAAVCMVGAVAVAVAFVMSGPRGALPEAVPRLANVVKLTSALGVEDYPSWSPSGRAMVYQSDQTGNWDIWVSQAGSQLATNRTEDSPSDDIRPSWSPDDRWIAFFSQRDGGGYYIMPCVGGKARRVGSWSAQDQFPTAAAWSPSDGRELVYARGQLVRPWLEIVTVATGESRRLSLLESPSNNAVVDLSWSPDGQWLTYTRALSDFSATSELWLTRVSDGDSFRLTDGTTRETSPTWSPNADAIYFVSTRGGASDLWRFRLRTNGRPAGPPQRVTAGLEVVRAVASSNGTRLALTKGRTVRNLFRSRLIEDRPATWLDVTQLTSEEADFEGIDVSADGRLVVASDRSGNWDVWTVPVNGGEMQQLTDDQSVDAGPRWRRGHSEVVFYSSRTGNREIWVLPQGGGALRQLTRAAVESWYPVWSPDGLRVAFRREDGVFIVPAEGGPEQRLIEDTLASGSPDWSPDGRWVLYTSTRDGARRVWRVPAAGGGAERLSDRVAASPRWSPKGDRVYFVSPEGAGQIWSLSVDSRQERPITALTGRRGRLGTYGLATDGHYLYFLWEESRADIWVADILQR